jgi:serine/threonine protein kinase
LNWLTKISSVNLKPEKIDPSLSEGGYTIKADIWSLGISLIEIATGKHPFKAFIKDLFGLMKSIINETPPQLDNNKFSTDLCSFVSHW